MKTIVSSIIFLTAILFCFSKIVADEITLHDGRVLSGTIISEPEDNEVRIKVIMGSMSMVMKLKRSDIATLSYGQTAEQVQLAAIQKQRKELDSEDSSGLWKLALELKKLKHSLLFKQYAKNVIAIDPQHEAAHRALGHVDHEGQWMSPRDKNLAMDKTLFEGKWIDQEIMEKLLVDREEHRLAMLEKKAERAEERRKRKSEARSQQFSDIQYRSPFIYTYGGASLYHHYPQATQYNQAYSSSYNRCGGLSFSASGSQSWGDWSLNFNR
ncbi:MAG: hypothetical protein HRU15_08680 [Planctomycetes bacterium]|nr:hypothetical protein [Planctomycetota bacterium]